MDQQTKGLSDGIPTTTTNRDVGTNGYVGHSNGTSSGSRESSQSVGLIPIELVAALYQIAQSKQQVPKIIIDLSSPEKEELVFDLGAAGSVKLIFLKQTRKTTSTNGFWIHGIAHDFPTIPGRQARKSLRIRHSFAKRGLAIKHFRRHVGDLITRYENNLRVALAEEQRIAEAASAENC